jgi:lipoprotein-anchoring transpeptidase ErfK/SrfK
MRSGRSGLVACCAVLAAVSVVARASSGESPKLSEGSHQLAYAGGLGSRQLASVPLARPRHGATCSAVAKVGSQRVAYAALVEQANVVVRRTPSAHAPALTTLGRVNQNGFQQVMGVIGVHRSSRCTADWYRVRVPVVQNGAIGWVRVWAVKTYRVRSRIVVDVSQRRLSLYRSGKLAFSSPVAVGAQGTPTPIGTFFVNERYVLPDASGPFGPYALGISAHSDTLRDVWVEDGPIGIHGTNEPWSIGHAASHGCVRVPNDVMRRIFPLAPAGTPVVVHP